VGDFYGKETFQKRFSYFFIKQKPPFIGGRVYPCRDPPYGRCSTHFCISIIAVRHTLVNTVYPLYTLSHSISLTPLSISPRWGRGIREPPALSPPVGGEEIPLCTLCPLGGSAPQGEGGIREGVESIY
jgi:hypothetical protein